MHIQCGASILDNTRTGKKRFCNEKSELGLNEAAVFVSRKSEFPLRLGAVRRLAYEAADSGLLSSDLAAGIRRVKGVKKLGLRLGNWLTAEQGQALWQSPDSHRMKGKRDRALLLACGLRRHEAVSLRLDHLQQQEDHWAIVDLMGKGGHIRTAPIPDWVIAELNEWLSAAGIDRGRIFRKVTKMGRIWATA